MRAGEYKRQADKVAQAAVERPADPLMDIYQATAYLGFKDIRTTRRMAQHPDMLKSARRCGRPKGPLIFRKSWLDEFLERCVSVNHQVNT